MSVQTYKTTGQFIEEFKSLYDAEIKQLSAAWSAAWSEAWSEARYATWSEARSAARYANLAVLAKDKITDEQFNLLTSPWTSCGLSLFVEAEEVEDNSPISRILDQRQEDYGDAKDNFTAIGRMWGAGLQIEDIPAFQVALQMAQLKIQRIIANPYKKDSWDDLLGYLHHAQNLLPERDGE